MQNCQYVNGDNMPICQYANTSICKFTHFPSLSLVLGCAQSVETDDDLLAILNRAVTATVALC